MNPSNPFDDSSAQARLKALFDSLNLAVSISEPHGDVKDGWPCIAYLVTIGGETFDYSLGVGHVKWVHGSLARYAAGVELCHFGSIVDCMQSHKTLRADANPDMVKIAAKLAKEQKVVPSPAEVLANCCREGRDADQTFANWCADFGYDEDSKKAMATYEACTESGKKARRLVGNMDIYMKLAELANEI
jgi:hypothetical protein